MKTCTSEWIEAENSLIIASHLDVSRWNLSLVAAQCDALRRANGETREKSSEFEDTAGCDRHHLNATMKRSEVEQTRPI